MSHYSDSDFSQFAAELRREQDTLLAALRQRLHQSGDTDELALKNYFADGADRAGADLLGDTDIALLQIELASLDEIEAALARIDAGSYGCCVACGAGISLKRLRAQPAARMCLPCQESLEKHRSAPLTHG